MRAAGILLHPTSLPSKYGIGDFGDEAYEFVDFLVRAKQTYWQVLPLGQTGYGDSPYQCFSAFAGNIYLISPAKLLADGFLTEEDLEGAPEFGEAFDRFGDARIVLLGEATHGTHEFYAARAQITRRLIERHGFNIVAVEGD